MEGIQCEECGMECCGERCLQEHKDLHFAEALQRADSLEHFPAATQPRPKRRPSRRGGQLTLNECFTTRQRRAK